MPFPTILPNYNYDNAGSVARGGYGSGPTSGSGTAYGKVPGPIAIPPSIYSQLEQKVPGLPQLTSSTASSIQNAVNGTLSPGTLSLLQDKAAQYGVNSGMPLSGLSIQNLIQNIGLTSEMLSQQGTKDYISFLTGTGSTMNNPNLVAQIEDRNATMAAAPDPQMAAQAQLGLLDKYLAAQSRPSSGSSQSPGFSFAPSSGSFSPNAALDKFWGFTPQQDFVATTSGVFPSGTPSSKTNPGTGYNDYYPNSDPNYWDIQNLFSTQDNTWSDPNADYWT